MRLRLLGKKSPQRAEFSAYRPVDLLVSGLYGSGVSLPVGRIEALSVPAVHRGRNLICSIDAIPLRQVDADNVIHRSALLEQFDPDVPNVTHMAQTVEDLLFDGIAWWLIIEKDFTGFPTFVRHLDPNTVSVQPPIGRNERLAPLPSGVDPRNAVVYVNGEPVPASQIIRFDSPNPALLKVGGRPIRRAILLDKAASMYADDPRPLDYFTPSMDADPAEDDEIKAMLDQWKDARKKRSTAYVPAPLKYNAVSSPSPAELQLVELQKQASLDIANALGVDPEDLGISTTSRTYANDVDRRRNKLNEVLAPYMRAITDRLSMGDVTRRGYRVVFDTTEYLMPNPGERWSTYQIALSMGAITVDEIREKESMPPLPASAEPTVPSEPVSSVVVAEASNPASLTFDLGSGLDFHTEASVLEFSVDKESRTIQGLALPYGKVASKNGMKLSFDQGSVQWGDPSRVKLLRDHDYKQPLGKATKITETSIGLFMQFKIARGQEGDRALELAEDGVLDGLSVGVDINDTTFDAKDKSLVLIKSSDLRETSLTAMPSFDDARVTAVAASRTTGGGPVPDAINEPGTPVPDPEPQVQPEPTAAAFAASEPCACGHTHGAHESAQCGNDGPTPVNPVRMTSTSFVREPLPYRFDRQGRFQLSEHEFSTDIVTMLKSHDFEGIGTDAGKRVMETLRTVFSTVSTGDVSPLNPTIQRPDLYAGPKAFKTPIWNMINNGGLPNGLQPFIFPRMPVSGSAIVVSGHSEGVEPPSGDVTIGSTTITPTALSGKTSITREVWDMGGNPAISNVLMSEFLRSWFEGLESASATFLNTLTPAVDINLGAGVFHTTLANNWNAALAGLQFVRSYNFSSFALEQWLYTSFANANDETGGTGKGRPLFPMIGPTNTDGTAEIMFRNLNLGGVVGVPAWSLTSVSGSANNSWLFDAEYVHGWASGPQRLEFPGTAAGGGYAPAAMIDLAVFGYSAFACRDISAVRQVIYDNT